MNAKVFHVYIMANDRRTLYTGVTSNLAKRVFLHKEKIIPGFTKKYRLYKLVYYEQYEAAMDAITREKEIKGWLRKKKIVLIESMNPEWKDLQIA
jgi:putative endonuclease